MRCFHCGKNVDLAGDLYIDIVLRQAPQYASTAPRIRYHANCFYEIAGLEFKGYFAVVKNTHGLTDEEVALLHASPSQKVRAIKSVRARTGLGLKQSKDMCDAYMQDQPT